MNKITCVLLYLDPGTGSLLIQFLIAGVLGVILFMKQLKQRIKYLFQIVFKKKTGNDNEEN